MQKLLGAWGKLVSGNAANGLLQLAIFAIAAQALELAALGVIILIQAYVRVVDGLLNFQSVNVLTNFMADAQEKAGPDRLRGLFKAGLFVDFGTAVFATLVALLCLPLADQLFGFGEDWLWFAAAYCLVILTRTFGAIEAGLRCFDRFGAISLRPVTASSTILFASLIVWVTSGTAQTLLIVWLCAEALANIAFLIWSMLTLRREGLAQLKGANANEAIQGSRNFWQMMWQTNFTYGLRIFSQEGDVLVVGALLGEAAAALLKAAKNLAALIGQFGAPLHRASSVPIARFVAVGETGRAFGFALKSSLGVAALGLIGTATMLVLTPFVLTTAFGPEFEPAYWIVIGLMLAKVLYLAGAALPPMMLALDIAKQFTTMILLGNIAFFGVLFALISPLGLVATVFAHLAFEAVWAIYGWSVTAGKARKAATLP
ncbi:hypothetical protein EH31_07570 [Erythrobacter longus]|uniref:Polysaccharide biosynthesis protein n=1 Tax=Erythrobacter longus TaxID=1044 RepID=A0A074MZ04_ERYLO|nr:hypothetical protein [Erythrobacter longus]KEO90887.1 hypothetical protein EH31_07570 [Erythrobacter longus]